MWRLLQFEFGGYVHCKALPCRARKAACCFGKGKLRGISRSDKTEADGTTKINKWIGHQDNNNVAEYVALLEALQSALHLGARTLHVFSDSEVVQTGDR